MGFFARVKKKTRSEANKSKKSIDFWLTFEAKPEEKLRKTALATKFAEITCFEWAHFCKKTVF